MVIINDYYVDMTASELKRWLKKQGCTFTEGKKAYVRASWRKDHRNPSSSISRGKTGTYNQILKDLGLKK